MRHTNVKILARRRLGADRPSFTYKIRESIVTTRYLRRNGLESPVHVVSSKLSHRAIGLQTRIYPPNLLDGPVLPEQLREPHEDSFVIKPTSGTNGNGVQLLERSSAGFSEARSGRIFSDWAEVLSLYPKHTALLAEEWIKSDDYKLYSFYGEVGLILRKRTVEGRPQYRWFMPDGKAVDTGKYKTSVAVAKPSAGACAALVRAARRVSLAVPLPFVRVDLYLDREVKPRLGEITPHPGGYFLFNREWDEKLGGLYEQAAARLNADLLNGAGRADLLHPVSLISSLKLRVAQRMRLTLRPARAF